MGKKRIEKIEKLKSSNQRKVSRISRTNGDGVQVTYCKRKKGLLKKAIELGVLCDLKLFIFIYDEEQKRVVHFASDENHDFLELFNEKNQREFYNNNDVSHPLFEILNRCSIFQYARVGGREEDFDIPEAEENAFDDQGIKIFSKKRVEANITSRLGSLLTQKLQVPDKLKQVLTFENDVGQESKGSMFNCQKLPSKVSMTFPPEPE